MFYKQVEGSIYLFALINPEHQDFLMRLQSAIAAYVDSPGKMPFNKFRAYRSTVREAEEPFRFVDGELLERFLVCDQPVQEEILGVVGSSTELESVRIMIEALRRLH
jgi:DNA damage-binding protein 1